MAGIYDERILGAKQQAETARKLREGIYAPEGQMVSGWYVAPSWSQYLAQGLRGYDAAQQEKAAQQQAAELEAQKAAEVADIQRQMTQPVQQSTISDVGPQMPTRQPTQRERMAALLRGISVAPEQFQPQLAVEQWQQGMEDKQAARQEALDARSAAMKASLEDKQAQREWQAQQAEMARQAQFQQQKDMARLAASLRPAAPEKLMAVLGKDGNPVMVPQSQAVGMTPFNAQTMKGEGTSQQRAADAAESNALLNQVEQIGSQATGSGIGRMRDTAAGFFGATTEGANAAAQMKVLGASLTAKVPKMSGPQSDKDVAMYKEAAGNIADPSVPWAQKQAAIRTIREINNRQLWYANGGKGQQQQPSAPTGGAKFLGFE